MKTKYVLAGIWKDGKKVYYVKTDKNKFHGYDLKVLSETIDEATLFDSKEEAEKCASELHDPILKIYPVCPICGEDYDEHPAISRKDNKTKICPSCGVGEAFMDYIKYQKKATFE